MTNSEKKKKNDVKNSEELMVESSAYLHTSEWVGALVRYLFFLGYRDFNYYYRPSGRQYRLNVFVGWLAKLVLFIGFVLVMLYAIY